MIHFPFPTNIRRKEAHMLHLYLIKSKRKRFLIGFAEYLMLSLILCFPCLAYINKFMPLPERLHVNLLIILIIEAAVMSLQHTNRSAKDELAEQEKNHKPFIRYILSYIINGLVFSLLLILLILIRKAFGTWVWGAAAIMIGIFAMIGTAFYFANEAACARLKEMEE